jgi:hypothetical protein
MSSRPGGIDPVTIPLGNGASTTIGPGQYQNITFSLPNRRCTLTAHVEGISGGNKDFDGLLMKDDDFKNWSTSHQARGLESGQVAAWSPSVPLAGPGTYHLVVSNAFSLVSTKTVTLTGSVVCP